MLKQDAPSERGLQVFSERKITDFMFDDQELLQKYPRLDMVCQYILQATRQALTQAELTPELIAKYRVGVIIGSTFGLLESQEKFLRMFYRTGKGSPMYFQQTANNLPSGIIAYKYRINGINLTLYNGWTAGLDSIILGRQLISTNQADIVITGGVDIINQVIAAEYNCFLQKEKLNTDFLFGEGAGVLVLEAERIARERKQKVIGVILAGDQRCCLRHSDFRDELRLLVSQTDLAYYFSNISEVKLRRYEREVVQGLKINTLHLHELFGECSAATGVLQTIYALYLGGESIILNAGVNRLSFIKSKGKKVEEE